MQKAIQLNLKSLLKASVSILLAFFLMPTFAQSVSAYGEIKNGNDKLDRVMITVFENDTFYKKTYTNHKGKFRFRVNDRKSYIALFYKPGHDFYAYKIVNKLNAEVQQINLNLSLFATTQPLDSLLTTSLLIKRLPQYLVKTYIENIYQYKGGSMQKLRKQTLIANALKEKERFKNEQKSIIAREDTIYRTTIGHDIYDKVIDTKAAVAYFKNDKPITEITYNFETKRRYDGILKRLKNTKNLKRYISLPKR